MTLRFEVSSVTIQSLVDSGIPDSAPDSPKQHALNHSRPETESTLLSSKRKWKSCDR